MYVYWKSTHIGGALSELTGYIYDFYIIYFHLKNIFKIKHKTYDFLLKFYFSLKNKFYVIILCF